MSPSRRPKGDGTIFRRPNGVWSARLWVEHPDTGRRRQVQVSGRTKSAVARKLADLRGRVELGQPAKDESITFGAFAEQWLSATLPASNRKQTTQQLYASLTTNHIRTSELSAVPLDRLRVATVESFLIELRGKGLADSTVRQIYTIGRAIGDAAVRDGRLGRNPFKAVPRPSVGRKEAPHLEAEEVHALLRSAVGSRYRPLFELMVNTALRRGEALALQWRDVDLQARTIFVRGTLVRLGGVLQVTPPKSANSRRHIPLSENAVAVLRELQKRRTADRELAGEAWVETGFVFTTQVGEPCEPRNALRALKVAAKAAGLGPVGLHTLRHSAATVMLNNGVPIVVVSNILGHSGIEITVDVYGHVAPHVSLEAVNILSNALRGGSADSADTAYTGEVDPTSAAEDTADPAPGTDPDGGGTSE